MKIVHHRRLQQGFGLFTSLVVGMLSSTPSLGFQKVKLAYGDPVGCANVLDGISQMQATVNNFPLAFNTGQRLSFGINLEKSFTLQEDCREFSSANVRLDTNTPYPKTLHFQSTPNIMDFLFESKSNQTFSVAADIGSNVGGEFNLSMTVTVVDKNFRYCIVQADFEKKIAFLSEHPDIIPPLFRGISFNKAKYSAGDDVAVTFHLSKPLGQLTTDHIEFKDASLPPNAGFPGYRSDQVYTLTMLANGDYVAKFTVPTGTKPGKYVLSWFNRLDNVGNFEDQVGSIDLQEKTLAQDNPLVVE